MKSTLRTLLAATAGVLATMPEGHLEHFDAGTIVPGDEPPVPATEPDLYQNRRARRKASNERRKEKSRR